MNVREGGATRREHLESLAARGLNSPAITKALADLDGPPMPESLHYLRDWLDEVHGRSGMGSSGLAPLTHTEVEAWARLKRITIEPHEVDALMKLDTLLLFSAQKDTQKQKSSPPSPPPRGRR